MKDLEELSHKELEDLSMEELMDRVKVNWDNHCYNPDENSCDGRCQGASNCPLAVYYNSRAYSEGVVDRPSKEEMIKHFKKSKINSILWGKFLETEKGKEFMEEVEEEMKKVRKEHKL